MAGWTLSGLNQASRGIGRILQIHEYKVIVLKYRGNMQNRKLAKLFTAYAWIKQEERQIVREKTGN